MVQSALSRSISSVAAGRKRLSVAYAGGGSGGSSVCIRSQCTIFMRYVPGQTAKTWCFEMEEYFGIVRYTQVRQIVKMKAIECKLNRDM